MGEELLAAHEPHDTILVVDDHDLFRFSIRRLLLNALPGWVVLTACTAFEAIEQVGRHHPRVCLIDYQMPAMNGLDAIPEVLARSPATRVLLMSFSASAALADRAEAAGAAGLIDKVTLGDNLEPALERVMGGGRFRSDSLR